MAIIGSFNDVRHWGRVIIMSCRERLLCCRRVKNASHNEPNTRTMHIVISYYKALAGRNLYSTPKHVVGNINRSERI